MLETSFYLDVSSAAFLGISLLSLLNEYREKKQPCHLAKAMGLHLIALVLWSITALAVGRESRIGLWGHAPELLAEAASLFCLMQHLCMDKDGRVRFQGRTTPIAVPEVLAAAVPILAGIVAGLIKGNAGRYWGFCYALSLSLTYMMEGRRREERYRQIEQEAKSRNARMLIQQMHSHFISNSLMCIEELCYINPETAAARIEDFAGYLRANMIGMASEEPIAFNKELEHIRQYVALEQADPGRYFEMRYEILAEDFILPSLVVQPVVENAIRHGALSRKDKKGFVQLKSEEQDGMIRITVEDNGTGEIKMTSKQKDHQSVAIENIKQRLEMQCHGTYSMEQDDHGTRVTITFPRMEAKG